VDADFIAEILYQAQLFHKQIPPSSHFKSDKETCATLSAPAPLR